MLGDAQGYRFEPKNLTIRPGDKVRFKMVSGGPHNIAFDSASIPAGAKARLAELTSSSMGNFMGPMLLYPDEAYIVTFADLPPGTYAFHCVPHLAMSQRGSITIR
jgi:plastocyanin